MHVRICKPMFLVFTFFLLMSCVDTIGTGPQGPPVSVQDRYIAVGVSGTILVSDDNGATYAPVASGVTDHLRGVAADGQGHCAIVGYNGAVLYSADYGDTWQAGTRPTINIINKVVSTGLNKFVAVGEPTGPDPYGIFRSTDGGKTWDSYSITVIMKGVAFRSATDFSAVGNIYQQDKAVACLSYSGGNSWTYFSEPGDIPDGTKALNDVVATISGYFVAVGRTGSVYSADGGSWSTGGGITGVLYAAAWSNPPGRIIAVGNGSGGGVTKGRVFYASSLGTSWTEVDAGLIDSLFDVSTNGNGRFAAVGANGQVVYSLDTGNIADSGTNWAEGESGVTVDLYGVSYIPGE